MNRKSKKKKQKKDDDTQFYDVYQGGELLRKMRDEDAAAAVKNQRLFKKANSRGCLWFAEKGTRYEKESQNKFRGTLIEVTLSETGKSLLKEPSIYFSHEYAKCNESDHPNEIIVKANERGAFGLGLNVIEALNKDGIKSIKKVVEKKKKKKKK